MEIDFSIIDSELKAYLIGLFYADAHLSDYVLQLYMSLKDREYVEKLANILNVKVHNKKHSIGFNLCSKDTIDSLRNLGFIKRKSYQRDDIVFRNIPDELKRHFIRGYFDGDGTIFISKYNKKNKNWKDGIKYGIGFISINKELLDSIKNYLSISLSLSDKNLRSENSGRFSSEISDEDPYGEEQWEQNEIKYIRLIYSGNVICKKILDFLYEGSTIYMDRKYNKYKEITIFEPRGYHFHKRSNRWRYVYDDNGLKKYKLFKTEDEVKNFIKNKIKNYESFTSKMVR